MDEYTLKEQLAYYNARAREYDQSIQGIGSTNVAQPEYEEANQEWLQIINALHRLDSVAETLELACGTGIWTQELMTISRSITALDGSPEMIEINRAKASSAAIEYECIDLLEWEPEKQNDLVFFTFWLSHISPFSSLGFPA